MSETIESFVQKLQKDGVEAGQAEADKLLDVARAEAEKTVAEAEKQAEAITADARAEAERTAGQAKDEMGLAARDVLLRLHQTVARVLRAVLERAADTKMKDEELLKSLIREVVLQYARKDAKGDRPIKITVTDEMLDALTAWAAKELATERASMPFDLKAGLKAAGFEYSSSGGTVEVTGESIAAVMSEMIAPRLKEIISKAVEKPEEHGKNQPTSGKAPPATGRNNQRAQAAVR